MTQPLDNRPLAQRDIILCCDCEGTDAELRRMIDQIEDAGIAANFFFVGETARAFPAIVRDVATRHQVESHTMTHPNLRKRDKESQRREIMDGRRAVEDTIGRPTRGFRAPYHCLNATTVEVLNEEGFCFDASMLYFRYDPGRLQSLKPTWFREWMPLYGTLGLNPETTFGIFRWLVKRHQLSILPAHPQYSGRDETLARAFGNFLKWARDGGATFWSIDRWLHAHRNIPLPEWMPEPRAGELR